MNIFLDANICLDLLDTTRSTSKKTVQWYLQYKDNETISFYFSADFITTIYYILTQKRKMNPKNTLVVIDELCNEIHPHYLVHDDFLSARDSFFEEIFDDFEDLLVLQSSNRLSNTKFITNDKELLNLGKYKNIDIIKPEKFTFFESLL